MQVCERNRIEKKILSESSEFLFIAARKIASQGVSRTIRAIL